MTVFEASNDTLKEFYVFLSPRPLDAIAADHFTRPPKKIAHWKKGQPVFYEEVATLPDEAQAWEFIEKYVVILERTGWKVLVAQIQP